MKKSELKEKILFSYREILSRLRRQEQVNGIISREKNLDKMLDKCAGNLIKWNLQFDVAKYVGTQFFALNYMPYLPKMMHIASDKGLERYHKYKDWFRSKEASIKRKKNFKRINKKFKINKAYASSLGRLDPYEEKEKKRFLNLPEGFMLCTETTTLWNPKSPVCSSCIFSKNCKILLKNQEKDLYDFRKSKINYNTFIKRLKKNGEVTL